MEKHAQEARRGRRTITLASLTFSLFTLWRLPQALGLTEGNLLFESQPLSIVLSAALFLLFRHAFSCNDLRLQQVSYTIGFVFSGFTLAGTRLSLEGAFRPFGWGVLLDGLFMLLLFTLVYGSGLLMLYQGAQVIARSGPALGKESLFSRVLGNGIAVFFFLLLCWLPVWLAFWPGTLVHDSVTQFYTYLDWVHNTHHPLLHTLLLGACIMLGIDSSAEGSAAIGLSIYSVVQMALMAAMLAYACRWLRRRGAPVSARLFVTLLFALFPMFSLWSFSAQKDVLFSGLVLLFTLELIDLWRDGFAALRSPLRILRFLLVAALMMLLRHNGLYALCLLIPFAVILAKGVRLRMAALLAGCIAVYLLANAGLVWATEAESSAKEEMLSIPLQQIARALRDHPDAMAEDSDGVLEEIFGFDPSEVYLPEIADRVKWAADDDAVNDNLSQLLSLWARLGVHYPQSYAEAFLAQNLPYFLPGAEMLYRLDLGIVQIELFPIEAHSYFPELQKLYKGYDQTLTLWGLPGVRLLSDTAFYVWLCIGALGLACYRQQKQWIAGLVFLLAVWVTCLLGPVALIRYLLCFFYAMPVVLAAMLAPEKAHKGGKAKALAIASEAKGPEIK